MSRGSPTTANVWLAMDMVALRSRLGCLACIWSSIRCRAQYMAGEGRSCEHPTLADVGDAHGHDAAVQRLEAELGAARRQRLDDARHVVADEDEARDLAVRLHGAPQRVLRVLRLAKDLDRHLHVLGLGCHTRHSPSLDYKGPCQAWESLWFYAACAAACPYHSTWWYTCMRLQAGHEEVTLGKEPRSSAHASQRQQCLCSSNL